MSCPRRLRPRSARPRAASLRAVSASLAFKRPHSRLAALLRSRRYPGRGRIPALSRTRSHIAHAPSMSRTTRARISESALFSQHEHDFITFPHECKENEHSFLIFKKVLIKRSLSRGSSDDAPGGYEKAPHAIFAYGAGMCLIFCSPCGRVDNPAILRIFPRA